MLFDDNTMPKLHTFLTAAEFLLLCSASVIENLDFGHDQEHRYFLFPGDGDNILHVVDKEEPVDYKFIHNYAMNPENNQYWLFTRRNPSSHQDLILGHVDSVIKSNFQANKTTVFLAHGWFGNGENTMNKLLTSAFLENDDVNVIVLDWRYMAVRDYITSRNGVETVGRALGQFAIWLTSFGLSYNRIHLVGFSLGGHLVGNAGKEANGRFRRITALDPAGPSYTTSYSDRLLPTDAQYVEVIHTNTASFFGFGLGFRDLCGDADFYPNGGKSQPGCILPTCSHSMAYEYMASSVKYNHLIAHGCNSISDAETDDSCTGRQARMGNGDLNKNTPGIFRIDTAQEYPFLRSLDQRIPKNRKKV